MNQLFPVGWGQWVVFAVAGATAFGLGRLSVPPDADADADTVAGASEARRPVLAGQARAARPAAEKVARRERGVDWSWEDLPLDGAARQAAITRQMEQVLGLASPSARLTAFAAYFQHYRPEDHESVIAAFRFHDQQGRLLPREYELFIQHCVAVEGELAVERMFRNDDKVQFHPNGWQLEAIAEWSGSQGAAAVAWWNELPDGNLREALAAPLIEGLARQDPAGAWNSAQVFPAGERVKFAGIVVQQHLKNGGASAAAAWIESLKSTPPEEIPGVQAHAAASLYHSTFLMPDLQRAGLMQPFVSEPWFAESGVGERLAGEWARKDPAAAGAWIKTHIPESVRQPMLERFAEGFRKAAPEQAAQFEAALAAE